jgi:hypothetical protein
MSNTIAHRPHVHHHVSLTPVFAVVVAIAIAAVVIWAINQPQPTITTSGAAAVTAPLVQPAAVAQPESPVFRHAQARVLESGGYSQAYLTGRLHQVEGTTLDPLSTTPSTASGERLPGSLRAPR